LRSGVTPKDLALHVIGKLGAAAGVGAAIEFAGPAIEAMEVEGRLTLCNLSVELGARFGMVAPDQRTFDFLRGKPFAPQGAAFDAAVGDWRQLYSDADAHFDREENMGLTAGQAIAGTPIDWVFIGSCANSRLSDLRAAADVVRGKYVADRVTAWVVPGSEIVKRAAEAEGLHEVFKTAGFAWREPGCSMCVAANGEQVPPQQRSVSTSNRNFVGRQGPGARTHLASPAMAAAAAIAGVITDVDEVTP
jgi:3-isopropylmalate/(R)-2-methylmalate dehydratase large subunit